MTTREVIGFVLAVLASLLCLWGGVREARLRRYGVHTEVEASRCPGSWLFMV